LVSKAIHAGFFPGIDLSQFKDNPENQLLIAVTEKRSKSEMDKLISFFKGYSV
jgi:glycine cleavage system pyridoxal-binding protein P